MGFGVGFGVFLVELCFFLVTFGCFDLVTDLLGDGVGLLDVFGLVDGLGTFGLVDAFGLLDGDDGLDRGLLVRWVFDSAISVNCADA